jgi:hypothetical protein
VEAVFSPLVAVEPAAVVAAIPEALVEPARHTPQAAGVLEVEQAPLVRQAPLGIPPRVVRVAVAAAVGVLPEVSVERAALSAVAAVAAVAVQAQGAPVVPAGVVRFVFMPGRSSFGFPVRSTHVSL